MQACLSVVIPTLDAAETLAATLAALDEGKSLIGEILVADGGSRDGTVAAARGGGRAGARRAAGAGAAARGGGRGGAAARGFFSFTPIQASARAGRARPRASSPMRRTASAPAISASASTIAPPRRAGSSARSRGAAARWACPMAIRGCCCRARSMTAVGGFRPLPLMEDVDLVRRIGRHRLRGARCRCGDLGGALSPRRLPAPRRCAISSASRLWRAGVPPRLIVRLYG